MENTIRYGIISLGIMGYGHAETIGDGHVSRAELTAVCDINPAALDRARAKFGDRLAYYTDYHEMLTSGKIDAVIIATPHYLHPIIAQEAFAAGLHVMSEKPAGVFAKNVREMNEAAAKSGKTFGIMLCKRTNPVYQKARELVKSGVLGQLKRLIWIDTEWYRTQAYYNSSSWRATWKGEDGGVMLNQCLHNLDLWQWIFGMPSRLRADCYFGKHHNIEVEDDVMIQAEYADGPTAVFISSTCDYPGTDRLEIVGDKAKIVVENDKIRMWTLSEPEREHCFKTQEEINAQPLTAVESEVECPGEYTIHKGILQDFTNAILDGTPQLAPGEDGLDSLLLCNAAYLSAWTGGKWIDLPLDDDLFYEMLQQKIAESDAKK